MINLLLTEKSSEQRSCIFVSLVNYIKTTSFETTYIFYFVAFDDKQH